MLTFLATPNPQPFSQYSSIVAPDAGQSHSNYRVLASFIAAGYGNEHHEKDKPLTMMDLNYVASKFSHMATWLNKSHIGSRSIRNTGAVIKL